MSCLAASAGTCHALLHVHLHVMPCYICIYMLRHATLTRHALLHLHIMLAAPSYAVSNTIAQ